MRWRGETTGAKDDRARAEAGKGDGGAAELDGSGDRGLLHRFLWKVKADRDSNEDETPSAHSVGST